MKTYKIIMHYVNGDCSYEEKTNETFEQMVEKYQRALQLNTIAVTGQADKKLVANTKNIIFIQIEEMK